MVCEKKIICFGYDQIMSIYARPIYIPEIATLQLQLSCRGQRINRASSPIMDHQHSVRCYLSIM